MSTQGIVDGSSHSVFSLSQFRETELHCAPSAVGSGGQQFQVRLSTRVPSVGTRGRFVFGSRPSRQGKVRFLRGGLLGTASRCVVQIAQLSHSEPLGMSSPKPQEAAKVVQSSRECPVFDQRICVMPHEEGWFSAHLPRRLWRPCE